MTGASSAVQVTNRMFGIPSGIPNIKNKSVVLLMKLCKTSLFDNRLMRVEIWSKVELAAKLLDHKFSLVSETSDCLLPITHETNLSGFVCDVRNSGVAKRSGKKL